MTQHTGIKLECCEEIYKANALPWTVAEWGDEDGGDVQPAEMGECINWINTNYLLHKLQIQIYRGIC